MFNIITIFVVYFNINYYKLNEKYDSLLKALFKEKRILLMQNGLASKVETIRNAVSYISLGIIAILFMISGCTPPTFHYSKPENVEIQKIQLIEYKNPNVLEQEYLDFFIFHKAKYEFDVKYVKDGSDYEKILEYAKYLKEREELGTASGQMTLDTMTSYSDEEGNELEKDIEKIINRIVESNDKDKIEHYADYRNYMTYEILLTNDVLTKAKLSKQSGYNSGAEVQIPYMLILLSALLMIYNDKSSSTRLVFIDEPFAKMDPTNVKIMLGFMKEQNLQMIFCAPDKTELIGNECEVVLPVLRTQPDLMEIGIIEMHKGV